MAILNAYTTVSVAQTSGKIQKLLSKYGVRRYSTVFDDDGTAAGAEFHIETPHGMRAYRLPVRIRQVAAALEGDPKLKPAQRTVEHAARVAWRIAEDWLKAQLALVDANMADITEVMLPYMLAADDRTMYELYSARQLELDGGDR